MSVLASIIPGITVAPCASTGFAPAGTVTLAPTASIRLPLMTIVPFAMTGPETVTMRALVIAQVGPSALPFRSKRSAAGAGRAVVCEPLVEPFVVCDPLAAACVPFGAGGGGFAVGRR